MAKKRTIDDIARLAGVSRTTVSRVLNHKADVDPATRERVLRVIREQNFVPSATAAGLAGGRSRLIGMLIPAWAWSLIQELTRGIIEVMKQTPYELVLYSINDEDVKRDRSEVLNRLLATELTAGLLAIFPERVSEHLTRLYQRGFPIVIVDDQLAQTTPWVSADNVSGAYEAVRHLIKLGHKRIAHIQGPQEYLVSHDRHRGYSKALLEAGISLDPELLLVGDFLPPSGRACASKLFELPPTKRPTAIFASSDQMAYGVLVAAEEYGLRVPQDIALVGFDDDIPSAHTHPALTTVRQPLYEMGQRGIELLLSMLEKPQPSSYSHWMPWQTGMDERERADEGGEQNTEASHAVHIQLPTRLIVRASCGANYSISFRPAPTQEEGQSTLKE